MTNNQTKKISELKKIKWLIIIYIVFINIYKYNRTIGIFRRSIQEIEWTNIKIIDWFLLKQLYYIFSLCFVVLALSNNNNVDSVIVFYIIPSFTHSSLVLNLSEFLSSAEHTCYSKECVKPNSCWSSETYIVFFLSIKVNVDQQLFGYPHSSKYLILCSAQ